jgi:hypothetical protein
VRSTSSPSICVRLKQGIDGIARPPSLAGRERMTCNPKTDPANHLTQLLPAIAGEEPFAQAEPAVQEAVQRE